MPSTTLARSLPTLLLGAGVIATLAGLLVYELLDALPTRPALVLMLIALLALGTSVILGGLVKLPLAMRLGWIFLIALVWFVGIKPLLATLLLLLAAVGIGWRLVPATIPARAAVAAIAGLGLIAGVLGWMVTLEWHHRLAYLLGALAIIMLWRQSIAGALRSLHLDVSEFGLDRASAAFAVLALGLASTALWLPSMLFDDLSYHLGLPLQLQHGAYYRADPATQLWALAPWAGDLIQAIPQVISRAESRGAVNAIWLITAAVLLWQIGRELGLGQNLRWLTLALFASFPLTPALMMGLHTEGPSIAIILAIVLVILRTGPEPDAATLRLLAILAGLALGLKLTNALSLVPLGLWLLIRWRGRLPWPHVPIAVVLFALIALPSMVHAWLLAGNPVLPLFNDVFLSEYARTDRFKDER